MENQSASMPPMPQKQQPAAPAASPPPTRMENVLNPKKPFFKSKSFVIFLLVVLFGAIFGGSFFVLKNYFSPKKVEEPKMVVAPTEAPKEPFSLTLESPVDGVSLDSNVLIVKGKTSPSTTVSYFTEDSEDVVESDVSGNFSGEVLLKNGLNTLIVTAYSDDEEKSVTVDVVYDEEAVLAASTSLAKAGNTGQSKKEDKSPLVGSVEEVSTNGVVVEDKKSKNKSEAQIDAKTKIVGKENKTLKIKDIKPKDMVAVIGSDSAKIASPGGALKKALKIFVKTASESAQMKRKAVQGVVSAINGNQITIVHQTQTSRTYTFSINENTIVKSKSQIVATSSLQVGQRVVAVGELGETGLVAKLIHIIPGKAIGVFKKNPVATGSGGLSPTTTTTPSATISPTVADTPTPTP